MNREELYLRQKWTLKQKIDHSLAVIDQFISYNEGNVYVAFSGGKDSTILMHLCEILKKDIKCVFVNTGCEYIDIIKFVNKCKNDGHNIEIIRPKMTPKEVWQKYGFPLVSKEIAENICACRKYPNSIKAKKALGIINPNSIFRLNDKWKFLITEHFDTSNKCCEILKKRPALKYGLMNGLAPIVGSMACESQLREKTYIRRGGCNVFGEHAKSLPLSIWLEQDIWDFIRQNNIEIADIYHKGACRTGCCACGFGVQFQHDRRLYLLHKLYPKMYEHMMNFTNNGVSYRDALSKVLAVNKLLLPDENPQMELFI